MKVEIVSALTMQWSEIKAILDDSSVVGLPDAEKKLATYFAGSTLVWVGKINRKIVCIYGLMGQCFTSDSGYMWMLHTKALEEEKFLFIRHSQMVIEEALNIYTEIHGHVVASNESGKRWLKWLGAEFGYTGDKVIPFMIRKKSWRTQSHLAQ